MSDSRTNGAVGAGNGAASTQGLVAWLRRSMNLPPGSGVGTGGLALIDQMVVSAGNFIAGVIIGRSCTQGEFGLYMLGFTIVTIATHLQKSLISTPYMVYSPRLSGRALASYTGSTLVHQLGVSLLSMSFLVLASAAVSFGVGPEGLASVMWALTLSIAFILFREFSRNVCFSMLHFVMAFALDSLATIIQISGLVLFASVGRLSAGIVFLIMGGACGLTGVVWLIRIRKTLAVQSEHIVPDFKRNWSFGKWIIACSVMWQASVQLYPWFLTIYHGPASTGIWAACSGAVGIAYPLLIATQNYIGPRIAHAYSRGGPTEVRHLVARSGILFSSSVLPFVLGLGLLGGWFVRFVYGENYTGYGNVVTILAINLLLLQFQAILSAAVVTVGRLDLEFATNVASVLVLCTLGWWLVREYGPIGAAYGTLASGAVLNLAKYVAYGIAVRQASEG